MGKESDKPFYLALSDLMDERDTNPRKLEPLTKAVDPKGEGYTFGYISKLARHPSQAQGAKPNPKNMTIIAAALNVEPTYFKEYRHHLAEQRARLATEHSSLGEVLEVLDELIEKWVGVEVSINNSGDAVDLSTDNFVLIDSEGGRYQPDYGALKPELGSGSVNLTQNDKVSGWLTFHMPKKSKGAEVRFSPDDSTTFRWMMK